MKDSRQLRCIGPIWVIFLFLPVIIVVLFFYHFFSVSLTEFILTGYSFFAGGGRGAGGIIKFVVSLLMESYAVNMQHFNGNLYSSAFTCSWKIPFGIHKEKLKLCRKEYMYKWSTQFNCLRAQRNNLLNNIPAPPHFFFHKHIQKIIQLHFNAPWRQCTRCRHGYSRSLAVLQVNSVLKTELSSFIHAQNVPSRVMKKHHTNVIRKR